MTVAAAFVLGLLTGSFLNVCIHRWPLGKSAVSPGSRCPRCSAPIAWYDNIPLVSYALLRARCRDCRQPIPARYPLVELLTAAAFALAADRFGIGPEGGKAGLLASALIVLCFTDLERFVLPNRVTLPGIAAGAMFSLAVPLRPGLADTAYFLVGWQPPPWAVSFTESAAGAVLFGGVLLAVRQVYNRLSGTDGLGLGDVKLVAMIAAFQGTGEALLVVLLGCLSATVVGSAWIMARGESWRTPLPLGTFLAAAGLACIFSADAILNRYWEFVLG